MDTNKQLNYMALMMLTCPVMLAILGEFFDTFPVLQSPATYYLQMIEVALTLVDIPLALKMMSMHRFRRLIAGDRFKYLNLAQCRLLLIIAVITLGVLFYYLTLDTSMLWCGAIGVVSLMYIWPTQSRMEVELEASKEEQN